MDSVWSEELEYKLVDLWQEHGCLYQVTVVICFLFNLIVLFLHKAYDKTKVHTSLHCLQTCSVMRDVLCPTCLPLAAEKLGHDSQRARTHRRHNSTRLNSTVESRRRCVLGSSQTPTIAMPRQTNMVCTLHCRSVYLSAMLLQYSESMHRGQAVLLVAFSWLIRYQHGLPASRWVTHRSTNLAQSKVTT